MKTEQLCDGMLSEVTSQVLEEAAFMFAEQEPDEVEALLKCADRLMRVTLEFKDSSGGWLSLISVPSFATLLAANLLGTEEGAPSACQQSKDAFKELLNIIGGHLVERFDNQAEEPLRLGIPEVTCMAVGELLPEVEGARCVCKLVIDSIYPLIVTAHFDHLRSCEGC